MSAAVSAVLLFLAFVPLPSPHLLWVALAPWLLATERAKEAGAGARAAARSGALLFGVFWALNLSWVLLIIPRLGVVWPLWAYAGQVLLLAILGAVAGAGIHGLRTRSRLPLPLAAALGWVGVEWVRGSLLGPLRFPWSPLALPLADLPVFIQPAAWIGETGLGLAVVLVNGLVALAWTGRAGVPAAPWRPSRPRWLAVGVVVWGAWWGAGQARLGRLSPEPVVWAAAVQPDLSLALKRDSAIALNAARESTDRLLKELKGSGAQVVVLPETHYPLVLDPAGPGGDGAAAQVTAELMAWASDFDAPILVGAFGMTPGGRTNAVARVTREGVMEVRGKLALVPGVEKTPGTGLAAGEEPRPFSASGGPVPLICIESAWSGLARTGALAGGGWILNVTNDGWLADSPWWTRSPAFHQHPRHLVLRSVETGLGALRVANNGLTGVVAPSGAWTLMLPPHEEGVALTQIASLPGGTPYRTLGDLAGPMAALALAAGLLGLARGRGPVDPDHP